MSSNRQDTYEQIGVAMTCRCYQEYVDMFQLCEASLARGPILDVASGASSFVAEANRRGFQATAADPLYSLTPHEIYTRGVREIEESSQKLSALTHVYDWSYYGNLAHHEQQRRKSLEVFVHDYEVNRETPRYVAASLPNLPLLSQHFYTILCSHFLFLYEEQFDLEFHLSAIRELVRLLHPEGELRLYPISGFNRKPYSQLDVLIDALRADGLCVDTKETPFRFLHSATKYLIVRLNGGEHPV